VKLKYSTAMLWCALLGTNAGAHWISARVSGVVSDVAENSVTVRTSNGRSVEAVLDLRTTYSRGPEMILRSEIRVGDHITVRTRFVKQKVVADAVQVTTVSDPPKP